MPKTLNPGTLASIMNTKEWHFIVRLLQKTETTIKVAEVLGTHKVISLRLTSRGFHMYWGRSGHERPVGKVISPEEALKKIKRLKGTCDEAEIVAKIRARIDEMCKTT